MHCFYNHKKYLITAICTLLLTLSSSAYSKKYKDITSFNESTFSELKKTNCKKGSGALYKRTYQKLYALPQTKESLTKFLTQECSVAYPMYPALGFGYCQGETCIKPNHDFTDPQFHISKNQSLYSFTNNEFIINSNSICYTDAEDRIRMMTALKMLGSPDKDAHAQALKDGDALVSRIALYCVDWHAEILKEVSAKHAEDKKDKEKQARIRKEKEREKARVAAEKKRVAEEKKRKAYVLARREKQNALNAKRAAELDSALAIPSGNVAYMLWSQDTEEYNYGKTYPLNVDLADRINLTAWDQANSILKNKQPSNSVDKPVFIVPVLKKGEFEKTADFNKRKADEIKAAQIKYDEKMEQYKQNIAASNKKYQALVKNKDAIFIDYLTDGLSGYLVKPRHTLKYNADKEWFIVTISSETLKGYKATGTLPISLDQAPKLKSALESAKPFIVHQVVDGKLVIQRLVLNTYEHTYLLGNVSDNLGNYAFTEDAANELRAKNKAALKKAEEEQKRILAARRKAEAEAKALKQVRKQEMEKQRAKKKALERSNWPAEAVARLSANSLLCTSYKSIYKAWAIKRSNNPYVSYPDECLETSQDSYIVSLNHMQGGMAKVRMYGATMSGYTISSDIEEN